MGTRRQKRKPTQQFIAQKPRHPKKTTIGLVTCGDGDWHAAPHREKFRFRTMHCCHRKARPSRLLPPLFFDETKMPFSTLPLSVPCTDLIGHRQILDRMSLRPSEFHREPHALNPYKFVSLSTIKHFPAENVSAEKVHGACAFLKCTVRVLIQFVHQIVRRTTHFASDGRFVNTPVAS